MKLEEFITYKSNIPLYAVIGSPVEHSISPVLHRHIYKCEKIKAQYIPIHVESDQLEEFVKQAKQKLSGFNVTIPHKSAIIPFLDEIDPLAKTMGSVNTVKVENGKLKGYNTDISGVQATFEKNNINLKGKKVLVLGDGGASRAVIHALSGTGAKVLVAHRPKNECYTDTIDFDGEIKSTGYTGNFYDVNIIINTTPVGMQGFESEAPLLKLPQRTEFVFDVIYTPLKTKLLKMAQQRKIAFENGLYMLLIQGVKADEIWFNRQILDHTIESAYKRMSGVVIAKRLDDVYHKKSILLSGFMGCGKSTVGKRLARELSFTYFDTDAEIEKQENMTVSEIFNKYGEKHFRKLESDMLKKLSDTKNAVISVGGGAMLNSDNYRLCENSLVLYLDVSRRTLWARLKNSTTRPLLQTKNPKTQFTKLLNERLSFYEKNCDKHIKAVGTVARVINTIYENI